MQVDILIFFFNRGIKTGNQLRIKIDKQNRNWIEIDQIQNKIDRLKKRVWLKT